jgi:hypothetical protein
MLATSSQEFDMKYAASTQIGFKLNQDQCLIRTEDPNLADLQVLLDQGEAITL